MTSRIYVSPDTSRGAGRKTKWIVKTKNSVISKHRKKTRAKDQAKKTARRNSPCTVVIQNQKGRIQTKRDY